jgi:hypothetical protein
VGVSGERPNGRPRQYDEDALVAAIAADPEPDVALDEVRELVVAAGTPPKTAIQLRRWLAGKVSGIDDAWSSNAIAKYRGALAAVADELPTRPRRRRAAA